VATLTIYRYFLLSKLLYTQESMDSLLSFYEDHADKIYNFCFWRIGNKEDAQDITSEAFLRFVKNKGLDKQYPQAYLYAICRNLIADHYHSKKGMVSLEQLVEQGREPAGETNTEQALDLTQIYQEMNALPDDQREAMVLRYVQDLNTATMCRVLDKTEASVKSLLYRGLETIRNKINI